MTNDRSVSVAIACMLVLWIVFRVLLFVMVIPLFIFTSLASITEWCCERVEDACDWAKP